ncbi:hypothetical protein KIN20_000756 [Parelaphostrongylus tenuis]|uniref:Uncharacterized protein n=1 Tax=Parelaphostrongylus tenuis TaxID=148309 RepID=A0AAD5LWP5_PARTN|nr:hypothetical protein KIN20_000756 [Parelaphostrongylus tenuis]
MLTIISKHIEAFTLLKFWNQSLLIVQHINLSHVARTCAIAHNVAHRSRRKILLLARCNRNMEVIGMLVVEISPKSRRYPSYGVPLGSVVD